MNFQGSGFLGFGLLEMAGSGLGESVKIFGHLCRLLSGDRADQGVKLPRIWNGRVGSVGLRRLGIVGYHAPGCGVICRWGPHFGGP